MPYLLIGDSGTLRFEKTSTITDESVNYSNKVTSNNIENGAQISDHAANEPIKFSISGVASRSPDARKLLTGMWRNRDLLKYRGEEAIDNLIITGLTIDRNNENEKGFEFRVSFQQVTFATAELVNITAPTMVQMDTGKNPAPAAKPKTQTGLKTTVTVTGNYAAHINQYNSSPSVNKSVAAERSNPVSTGYKGVTAG